MDIRSLARLETEQKRMPENTKTLFSGIRVFEYPQPGFQIFAKQDENVNESNNLLFAELVA